jgi:hypothetical protein
VLHREIGVCVRCGGAGMRLEISELADLGYDLGPLGFDSDELA